VVDVDQFWKGYLVGALVVTLFNALRTVLA
jgi:hypothetical protein